jgi:hypothetical protein
MKKEKKLSLEELKVQSFRTTLTRDEQKAVNGGGEAELGITFIKIYC